MTTNHTNFTPAAVSLPTHTTKQDKPTYLSPIPTLQVRQYVTLVDSNRTWKPEITMKVMFFTIYGDPMYLIEGTPNQTHQHNIDSLREPSDSELFFINSTIRPLNINTSPKPL